MSWRVARLTALVAAVVALLGAFGYFLLFAGGSDDERAEPPVTSATPSTTPTTAPSTTPSPTPTPTPTTTATPACEDASTRFNESGEQTESLLPDCGQTPAPAQAPAGLTLACGGDYPVILYKSTTSGAKTSVCGKDAVGDRFRLVVQPTGGDPIDMDGTYAWRQDAFVGEHEGTKYVLHGVDGSLHVTKGGATKVQRSSDWISLDNEVDDGD